jgi:hypothetical protein
MNTAYDLQFLESSENVRSAIVHALGREPNTEISRGVGVYIRQGRMFLDAASVAPLEIRPLPLYYGMMALGKAIIAGRGYRSPATLHRKHGLRDVSLQKSKLADLTVEIGTAGTFQEFNDVICGLEGIDYFEDMMTQRHILPTAASVQLVETRLTLEGILSHMSGLQDIFRVTFAKDAQILSFVLFNHGGTKDPTELRIDLPAIFTDLDSLRRIIQTLRVKYPILGRWSFASAQLAWDNSIILFKNVQPPEDELTADRIRVSDNCRQIEAIVAQEEVTIDFRRLLEPTCCGLTEDHPTLSAKINELYVSEASLQYAGMFLLGSLVRYQPQIWVHSVTRLASHERPADDQALAIIERFMSKVQSTFPRLVVRLLTQP